MYGFLDLCKPFCALCLLKKNDLGDMRYHDLPLLFAKFDVKDGKESQLEVLNERQESYGHYFVDESPFE